MYPVFDRFLMTVPVAAKLADGRDFFFVDGEVEGRHGAEHHAEERVANKNPARGAQPVRLRLANAAHLYFFRRF